MQVEERQLSEASWSCLPASQAAASLTQSDSTQISSQAAGRCCTAAASMASPKALVAASMPLPVQASGAPLAAAPGFQVAAQLTFQYGPIAPGPFTAGCLPPAAIMHPGATSVMTSAPPPFGVALGQPQMAVFPTWHFAGSSPGKPELPHASLPGFDLTSRHPGRMYGLPGIHNAAWQHLIRRSRLHCSWPAN